MSSNAEKIFRKYNSTPDEDWKEIIRKSAIDPMVDGIAFPLVPDKATQCYFVGSTLENNVHEPYQYYKSIKDTYVSQNGKIGEQTKLLDAGSGWGRIIRFFMKDITPSNLKGCDVSPRSIDICNSCFRGELNFQLINPLPLTPYEDDCFDIIEGYSVFTHLSYYAVTLWMHEYFRILRPGGMLAMTVWQPRRFDIIRQLQKEPLRSPESERYFYRLQTSFSRDCELEEDLYGKTGFVFIPYSSDAEITYGEAFLSPDLLVNQWSSLYEHITTFQLDVDQQIVFLRKRPDAANINHETLQETARIAKLFDVQSICIYDYKMKMMSVIRNDCRENLAERERLLEKTKEQLAEKTRQVEELLNSSSWRVTGPLRRAHEIILKLKER